VEPIDLLLGRDPAWRPPAAELPRWLAEAEAPGAPPALASEARWWRAWEAAGRGDWAVVSALAEAGLAEPASEREAVRLALLHVRSGNVAEAQHVLSQAVQWRSDEGLLRRFADACDAEGFAAAAARFRAFAGGR
jgi:hypothetical protein